MFQTTNQFMMIHVDYRMMINGDWSLLYMYITLYNGEEWVQWLQQQE